MSSYNKDNNINKNVSNISLTKETYKKLKMISVDKEITLQEVCAEVLEKAMSKKYTESISKSLEV